MAGRKRVNDSHIDSEFHGRPVNGAKIGGSIVKQKPANLSYLSSIYYISCFTKEVVSSEQ